MEYLGKAPCRDVKRFQFSRRATSVSHHFFCSALTGGGRYLNHFNSIHVPSKRPKNYYGARKWIIIGVKTKQKSKPNRIKITSRILIVRIHRAPSPACEGQWGLNCLSRLFLVNLTIANPTGKQTSVKSHLEMCVGFVCFVFLTSTFRKLQKSPKCSVIQFNFFVFP